MPQDRIIIRGARQHNLKNIDLELPRDRLIVITGLSGSGKSSLAFDTIYAEGQRRYVESLSAYARQFLGQMEKPDVDHIDGLSPAISIDQRSSSRNPRSTVGTVTEIYDYMRLLYARIGVPHCPTCGRPISRQTVQQIVDAVMALPEATRFMILAPLIKARKGEHRKVFEDIRRAGFVRARVNGEMRDVSEEIILDRYKMHTIEAVIDRLVVRHGEQGLDRTRLADSLETALKMGGGVVLIAREGSGDMLFSEHFACEHCGISLPEIEPRTFSFNSPHGACPACGGLGVRLVLDPELILAAKEISLAEGAILPWSRSATSESYYGQMVRSVAKHYGFSVDVPIAELGAQHIQVLLYGSGAEVMTLTFTNQRGRPQTYETTFEGVIPNLERRYKETSSDYVREEIERYMTPRTCEVCGGARLRPESLAVTVAGRSIVQVAALPVLEARDLIAALPEQLSERDRTVAQQILKELNARLGFLVDVGLDYLTLDRAAATLSGGEAQRIRLATQIGSQLMGVLYILDEPSIGLHQRDNARLIETLKRLRDLGNTVLVVEHDEETIREADYVVDLGPGAGENGGHVVAAGPLSVIEGTPASITGQFLRGERCIPVPAVRRNGREQALLVRGAREHNLKDIDVRIPLGKLVCITGVSGSGKSSLLMEIVYKRLAQALQRSKERPGAHRELLGIEHLDKVIDIDQSPIGRTPRSNPATYTGLFAPIRELFASVPEARLRGYKPGRFSFNVKGGRCEACQGDGIIKIEMQFLPDVYVPCEVCHGKRYNREALEILYRGKSIAEVLDMTVQEAIEFFGNIPALRSKLETLYDVGLGYIRLGQPATTLSGGEAQRVKLSRELSRRATGRTLYILDEPTVGLHMADVERLLQVLGRLVDAGNTVLIIEHSLDVIKTADWVIDLGPEGGAAGGRIIAEGTPEQIAAAPGSYTGQYLKRVLGASRQPSTISDQPEADC
ncbi:MAG TPA: excinuclease ABC subunit UvrA [Anaerolineae bacterium]|nr:excinuclease ABC subunit UvrA [Anaerolineae bacterium]HOQ98781.1 excinuclease ABC subunit UvrA [Anaerolineae bacterium]HPL28087.1 excinuclease ABC subunit UvrA [Anaerolineae bacterium]